jgi:NADH dehydrogenase FAD-containing subunit
MEPIRSITRHKQAAVKFYEAEATKIDAERKVVLIDDNSEIRVRPIQLKSRMICSWSVLVLKMPHSASQVSGSTLAS